MINPNFDDPFERWYYGTYIAGLDPDSAVIINNSPQQQAKYSRMCEISKYILANPNVSDKDVRKWIILKYFASPRSSLDWLMQAKMIVDKYKTEALNNPKKK